MRVDQQIDGAMCIVRACVQHNTRDVHPIYIYIPVTSGESRADRWWWCDDDVASINYAR